MVEYSSRDLDLSFHALSDPTRRAILATIAKRDSTISELAGPFDMSFAAISKHIQVLEQAKFLKKIKTGRVITCQATLEPLDEMTKLLENLGQYWSKQLDSLERYLAKDLDKGDNNGQQKKRSASSASHSARRKSKKR